MHKESVTELSDRGLVKINGSDCSEFLQNLISCNIQKVESVGPQYGALLSPQGKLLFDFIIIQSQDFFLFDIQKSLVSDFIKKLTMYKLRADVDIEDLSDKFAVIGIWNADEIPDWVETPFIDPRFRQLGYRVILERKKLPSFLSQISTEISTLDDYNQHRIELCIPTGVNDFDYGTVFPHDINMDYLNGIDFSKGCFVGQEVVSRMRHRGTARRRCINVFSTEHPLSPNVEISADGKNIGLIGSTFENLGIAIVRLDRAKSAFDDAIKFLADGIEVEFKQSKWTDFNWPE